MQLDSFGSLLFLNKYEFYPIDVHLFTYSTKKITELIFMNTEETRNSDVICVMFAATIKCLRNRISCDTMDYFKSKIYATHVSLQQ